MAGGAAFADILDQKVSGLAESGRIPDAPLPPRFIPPHPLLFTTPHRPFRSSTYRVVTCETRSADQRPVPPRPASVRPSRTLTRRQRQALDAFIERGAPLTPDFTPSELRSAFRMLALAYHPDRHPATSEAEKSRLTRVLAGLNEHHQALLGALQSAA